MSEPAVPILLIRGQRVILDADLAQLYGVETKALNRAVKRNSERFPGDFLFRVTREELDALRYQTGTSKPQLAESSRFVTTSGTRGGRRNLPYAFTEFGALMAGNVLNSSEAVKMSLYVIRAFVKIREELTANNAILKRLAQIDDTLFLHDKVLRDLYQKLRPLLAPPPDPSPKPQIGFKHK